MVELGNVTAPVIRNMASAQASRNQQLQPKSEEKPQNNARPEDVLDDIQAARTNTFEQGIESLLKAQEDGQASPFDNELTPEEQQEVQELQQRDQEVRAHEQAHKTVGGPYAGTVSYETVTGPDGREYAIAGEVDIDVSPVPNNPEATIRKMEIVVRAALAPAEPSPQDRAVAAQAQQIRLQAQQEAAQIRQQEQEIAQNTGNNSQNALSNEENTPSNTEGASESAESIIFILFGKQ